MSLPASWNGLRKKGSKLRGYAAAAFSCLWVGAVFWWTFVHPTGTLAVPDMKLNEWGDWAAGVAAPLAFLWLVVGYLQQGQELDGNARALTESIEKQNLLVEAAQRQAVAAEAANRPWLRITSVTPLTLAFQENSVAVVVHIDYQNLGRSPAHSVEAWVAVDPVFSDVNAGPADTMAKAREWPGFARGTSGQTVGEILFPSEKSSTRFGGDVSKNDFEKAFATAPPNAQTYGFYVAIYLEYKYGSDAKGYAQQAYMLRVTDPTTILPTSIGQSRVAFQGGELRLWLSAVNRMVG